MIVMVCSRRCASKLGSPIIIHSDSYMNLIHMNHSKQFWSEVENTPKIFGYDECILKSFFAHKLSDTGLGARLLGKKL